MDIITIVIYVILFAVVYKAITGEKRDLYCPKGCKSHNNLQCDDGKSKFFGDGKGEESDTLNTLLEKIGFVNNSADLIPKWRRCLIIAFISSLLIGVTVYERIPKGKEIFISTLVIMILMYGSYSYYEYHYTKYPKSFINNNIAMVREKLKLKPKNMFNILELA